MIKIPKSPNQAKPPSVCTVTRKRVASLTPSPENEILYRPIKRTDPEVIKLAKAIAKNGCDPMTVTADGYIVSGHRRLVALLIK